MISGEGWITNNGRLAKMPTNSSTGRGSSAAAGGTGTTVTGSSVLVENGSGRPPLDQQRRVPFIDPSPTF